MCNWTNKANPQCGFTLIEVIASIAIIATVTVALLAVFPRTALLAQSSNNITAAAYLAQQGIETALSTAFYGLATGTVEPKQKLSADPDSWLYNFERQTEVVYVDENLADSAEDTELKKITTTVFWHNPRQSAEQSYILTTLYTSNKVGGWIYGNLSYAGATRTGADCIDAGGSLYDSGSGTFCKFNAATCPGGWSQADSWQRYNPPSWGESGDPCGGHNDSGPSSFSNQTGYDHNRTGSPELTFGWSCNESPIALRWLDYFCNGSCNPFGAYTYPVTTYVNPSGNRIEIGCK